MKQMNRRTLTGFLAAAFLLASCSAIDWLSKTATAIQLAVPILAATGLGGPYAAYGEQAASAIVQVTAELESADAAPLKAEKITAILAGVAAPDLTGAPATVVNAIQMIAMDLENLAKQYSPQKVKVTAGSRSARFDLKAADRNALEKIRKKAQQTREALRPKG